MILFLGAGASKPFEIPTTKDFAIDAIKTLSSDTYKKEASFLEEIKDTFKDKFDLEILLTVLDDLSKDDVLEIISPVTVKFILEKRNPKKYIEKKK